MAKKVRYFVGVDLSTLKVGSRAVLKMESGEWVSTSPIMSLVGRFEIETQNTIYYQR